MSRIRRDTLLSVAAGLGGQAALLVTGVIAARALGVEQRGHFAFIFLVAQAVALFGSLGLPLALTYFIASDNTFARRIARRVALFTGWQVLLLTTLHVCLLAALFWNSASDIQLAAAISVPTSGAQIIQQSSLGVLQGLRRFRSFNALRLLGPVGYAILATACWVLDDRTLVAITVAYAAAYVFAGIATALVAVRCVVRTPYGIDRGDPTMRDMLSFGLRGLLGAASPLEAFRLDQSVVGLFLAPAALGIYVSAISFTNLPRFTAQSIGMVAYPNVARQPDNASRRRTMWRFVVIAVAACAVVVIGLELCVGWLIPFLFGSSFRPAIPVARILLVAGFLIGVRRILSDCAPGLGRPGISTIAEITSWVLLVPTLLVCVHFGLIAVAWGLTACAGGSVIVLLALLSRRGERWMSTMASQASLRRAGRPQMASVARPANAGWVYVLTAVTTICAGLLVSRASPTLSIALICAAIAVLLGAGLWSVLSRTRQLSGLPEQATPDDGRFKVARWLVYAGLLTSCWLRLRFHGVTLSDALFLLALCVAFVGDSLSPTREGALLPSAIWVGILLFVAGGMLATIAHSHHKVSSVGVILRVFYLVAAWFWLAAICLRTRNQIWAALKFWVVSAAVCGVWALAQKYVHVPGGVDADRFAGLADHVNDLGSLTACALVPALALAYRAKKWTVAVVGIAVGLVLSGSIGAGIAALAALAVGLVSRELTKPTLVAIAVGAVALVLASPLIGTSAVTRFSTATSSFAPNNQDTLNTRLRTYKAAWHRIEQSPLLGSGLDLPSAQIYDPQSGNSFQVHNLFLGRLYDSGILGLAGILVLVTCLGVAGWRLVISSPDRYLSLALFAGFVAYVAADMSEPSLYKRYSLVPAFLIIAFRAVAIRLEAHRPEPVAEPAPTAGPLRGRVAPHPRPIPVPAQLGRP